MFLPSSGICAAAAGGQRIKKYIAEFLPPYDKTVKQTKVKGGEVIEQHPFVCLYLTKMHNRIIG